MIGTEANRIVGRKADTYRARNWSKVEPLVATCLLIWAGVAIGGDMIAAPAKFQVQSLELGELLKVGRAQFAWLAVAEWLLLSASAALLAVTRRVLPISFVLIAVIFLAQQLWLQPLLEDRSDLIIAGKEPTSANLHLTFIALETLKICLLIFVGFRSMPAKGARA